MDIKAFERKIYLSSPTMHGLELEYMTAAYRSNWMSTIGENIDEIEKAVCELTGCKHAVALSSCTAALHLAVKLAGIKPGDKVFCSDMTFSATVNPVLYEGAVPILIDAEYETWNMDPLALERAFELYPDVKHVVLAHLYGSPAKLDEIKSICADYGAAVIEDAAESLGATYKGKQTGSFGDISCISFNGNKIITGSSGGMLLCKNADAAAKARKWATQSRENAAWYQHEEIGYNYGMSNVIAGAVRGQLPYLEEHISRKREIYFRYKEGFKNLPVSMNPYDEEHSIPNFWLSCLLIEPGAMCRQSRAERDASFETEPGKSCPDEILERLAQHNAEGRPIWKPMHMQPLFKENAFVTRAGTGGAIDVGGDMFSRGLCLPSDNKMTDAQQDIIIEIVKTCFK